MFAYGFPCCRQVCAPASGTASHSGPRAWEVLGKSSSLLLLGCSRWGMSNISLFCCESLTTANGEMGQGKLPGKNTIPFPLSHPPSFVKMLWGWDTKRWCLSVGNLLDLGVDGADASANMPAASLSLSLSSLHEEIANVARKTKV